MDREKMREEVVNHYKNSYIEGLGLKKFPGLLEGVTGSSFLQTLSSKNRLTGNIQMMKYTYTHVKTGSICACFKMSSGGTTAIYAYLYSRFDASKEPNIQHEYFCCSGAFKSQDGEYRNRFLTWFRFKEICEKYPKIIEAVEKLVVSKLSTGSLILTTEFYYPSDFQSSERKFEDEINSLRLPIKFYIFCWLCDFHTTHVGTIENHINPDYLSIIYKIDDQPTYDEVINEVKAEKFNDLVDRLSKLFRNLDVNYVMNELECGQKIFPMTAFEAIKIDDINFSIWREIYISNLCSNLVLNFITPSFPFINNWFFIENTQVGLFDNASMHDKYKQSAVAESISSQLRDIDKHNYVERSREHGPINSRFMRLSKRVQRAIVYADSAIKLTDLAVCVTSEYVGRTFRDIPAVIANTPSFGFNKIFTDLNVYLKHIFEFLYSFYCMNTKIKLIHGDLHMNNITLFQLYKIQYDMNVKSPNIIYILRDTIYKMPHYGIYSCIIDFSRSIIGDKQSLAEQYGDRYANLYFREQKMRMMRMLFTYFSKFMERNHNEISAIIENNFDLAFKIMTAIDPFVMCSNVSSMLSIDQYVKTGFIKLHPEIMKYTNRIASAAEGLILENFKRAISGDIKSADDIEWPNYIIIKKYFERYEISDKKSELSNVVDVFNENNDINYQIEEHDQDLSFCRGKIFRKLRDDPCLYEPCECNFKMKLDVQRSWSRTQSILLESHFDKHFTSGW